MAYRDGLEFKEKASQINNKFYYSFTTLVSILIWEK